MKILVDFQDTIGGAPRSMKEHALVLKEMGHEIIAIISEREHNVFFEGTGFKIFQLPRFRIKNVIGNLELLGKYRRIISNEKVDLITANRVTQCQFLSVVSDLCKVPILNARAGGFGISDNVKVIKDKHFIVYSEENLSVFIEKGYSENHLFLVKNRLPEPLNDKANQLSEDELVITLTGSVKEVTINGLIWFLKFIRQNYKKNSPRIVINLAGGNILKKNSDREKFEAALLLTQKEVSPHWKINHLGWVENIVEVQAKSHVCIGKGRSVVEPAMMGKICFVISETGAMYRCKIDNYSNLSFFNFSGRGEICEMTDSQSEFLDLLNNSVDMEDFEREAKSLIPKFKAEYAMGYAKDKLEKIITQVESNQELKNGYSKGIGKLFRIYVFVLTEKLKKFGLRKPNNSTVVSTNLDKV